jgi:predicted transcriptional regulator
MLMDYSQKQENSLFDLSLSLTFNKIIKSLTKEKDSKDKNYELTIKFFEVIRDFCNKQFSELNNEFSGADAFSIFTSALNNMDIKVETIDDVLEEAEKYHNYLISFKAEEPLEPEKLEELIKLLEELNNQLSRKLESNQMNSWGY